MQIAAPRSIGAEDAMKKPKKPKKQTTLREDIAKYLLDVNKLVLGSIVISSILRRDLPQDILMISGIAIAIVSLILGIALGIKEVHTDKKAIRRPKRRKR